MLLLCSNGMLAAGSTNSWQEGNNRCCRLHCYLKTTVSKSAASLSSAQSTLSRYNCLGFAHLWCDKGWLLSPTTLALQPFQALISRPQERIAQGSLLCVPPASDLLAKTLGPPPARNKCKHLQ